MGDVTASSVLAPGPGVSTVNTMETGASEGSGTLPSLEPKLLSDPTQPPPLDMALFGGRRLLEPQGPVFKLLWILLAV